MNPLQLLEDPLRALLDFLHDNVNLTYGWSIVVLTVIVRIILLPLVIKQYASMRRMQAVAPQIKELQRKYKGNRQKLQEEMMAFYKENEINPFASCLPLVFQIPVFIALYYVLREFAKEATVGSGSLSFMWVIPDIRVELNDIGWGAGVIVAIYALSQLLSTELSATPNMPETQRRIMRIIPLGVVLFVFQFPVPSGLVLYWMTTNLWTAGQQLVMRHRIGLHLADPESAAEYTPKKGSRTPPKAQRTAALADGAEATETGAEDGEASGQDDAGTTPRQTPRKRRRRGQAAAAQGEAVTAPEPASAPEAADAPEPDPAPEPEVVEDAPADAADEPPTETGTEDGGSEPKGAADRPSGGGASGQRRRQPRARGTAKGSRPASAQRTRKKKR
ncbi:MAG: YidC/Oxa1 family membrane protein insertase [Thermoleophilia bacterium]